jgi:hypothetical protein
VNSWKLILATVVIFGAGVVVGGMLIFYTHPRGKSTHHGSTSGAAGTNRPPADLTKVRQPELLSQQFVQQLDDALQLTPAQLVAIQKIITDGQEQNHGIWTNCAAQSRQVMQTVRQEIREQLNADQIKLFEKLLKQNRPAPKHPAAAGTNSPAAPKPVVSTNTAAT